MVRNDPIDDKLSLFRQQVNIINHILKMPVHRALYKVRSITDK